MIMGSNAWYWILPGSPATSLSWVALSLIAYMLATNLTWTIRWILYDRQGQLIALMQSWWLDGLVQGIRLFYYVIIPYIAVRWGVLNLRNVGLAWILDPVALRQVVIGAGGLTILLMLTWAHYACSQRGLSHPTGESWLTSNFAQNLPLGWAVILREAIFAQAHWAFYRGGFTLLLQNIELGSWLALVVILLEGYLNPWLRHDLKQVGRAEPILLRAQFAVVSTALILIGGSTWLNLGWHAALALAVPWWVHTVKRHNPSVNY
jgi:hypothetical protein